MLQANYKLNCILHTKCGHQAYVVLVCDRAVALFPGSYPAFSHRLYKLRREPGWFDHVGDDVLCVVWI